MNFREYLNEAKSAFIELTNELDKLDIDYTQNLGTTVNTIVIKNSYVVLIDKKTNKIRIIDEDGKELKKNLSVKDAIKHLSNYI